VELDGHFLGLTVEFIPEEFRYPVAEGRDVRGLDLANLAELLLMHEDRGPVAEEVRGSVGPPLEELWVIADLAELHDEVHEVIEFGFGVKDLEEVLDGELALDGVVESSLPVGHDTLNLHFPLLADLMLHILLQPPQHEGLQNGM
jgi:hypothetical protein